MALWSTLNSWIGEFVFWCYEQVTHFSSVCSWWIALLSFARLGYWCMQRFIQTLRCSRVKLMCYVNYVQLSKVQNFYILFFLVFHLLIWYYKLSLLCHSFVELWKKTVLVPKLKWRKRWVKRCPCTFLTAFQYLSIKYERRCLSKSFRHWKYVEIFMARNSKLKEETVYKSYGHFT